ncbi:MAG TPA: CYTH domain-containing protein [Pseudohongiella sp.]|nr:CYTH domain-containing protein [Pseudohongiella sp.]
MATEIERKFLVDADFLKNSVDLSQCRSQRLTQGYLCKGSEPSDSNGNTVRIRICGDTAVLTIKGPTQGISRTEFEYPVPLEDAQVMVELCKGSLIDKTRYWIEVHGHIWEVDEFHGRNQGLWLAEIELESEFSGFIPPDWVGREVSDDPRYYNAALAVNPLANCRSAR